MKIVIPGGSGQVGTMLARALHGEGHEVIVLSRQPTGVPWRSLPWDGVNLGAWVAEMDGVDVVINLAGRSVNCRYHARQRREILESRVKSTHAVGAAIACVRRPPRVWLQASTATIYTHRYDAANDEATGVLGGEEPDAPETWRFSIEVARAWERTFDEAVTPGTRKVKLRSAMTMSADPGGVFATLLGLTRCGLGGSVGEGRQFVSWIHEEDFIRAVHWLIDREEFDGAVNLAAPQPLPYAAFMRALREAAGMPFGLPTPRWMLEIGCLLLRTESELVLKSRRVVPGRLLASGFEFRYSEWPGAARALCAAHRQARTA
ncbi:MAG: TIGR01777 family oxidoreductase [Chthoniobacter sp.]|uniref:TIGR01777 family oxidoreductase n=1 Tax=Chthoniobacter sp. TaxID=2510640 RepID=UPI0032A51A89